MIAEILRRERKQKGITQQEAAEIFNVTRQTISNWENERNYPDIPTLVAISEYYEISLDYLMKGDNRYMAKMKKEARLMQSIRMGLFSVIAGGILFFAFDCHVGRRIQWRKNRLYSSRATVDHRRCDLGRCHPFQKFEGGHDCFDWDGR